MFYFVVMINTFLGLIPMIILNHFLIIPSQSSIIRDMEIRERDETQLSINDELPDSFYERVQEMINKEEAIFEEVIINDETSEEETNLLLNSKRKKK